MQPTMDLRLKSMSRSLESVILPAIDTENALALTQAHVIMAHIGLIRQLLDHLPEYGRLEHRSDVIFATELAAVAEGGPVVHDAVAALRSRIDEAPSDELLATPAELRASSEALAVAGEALVKAMAVDGDALARARIITISMESLGETANRELRWFDASQDPAALLEEWRASLAGRTGPRRRTTESTTVLEGAVR